MVMGPGFFEPNPNPILIPKPDTRLSLEIGFSPALGNNYSTWPDLIT